LEVAALTPAPVEGCRTQAAVIRADFLVEGQEITGEFACDPVPFLGHGRALGVDDGHLCRDGRIEVRTRRGKLGLLGGEHGDCFPSTLEPLHDLEFDVLEVGLSSSE
jgi:hypothetical protein